MAKITELDPPPSPLTGAELVPVVQDGEMWKTTLGDLIGTVAQPYVDNAAAHAAGAEAYATAIALFAAGLVFDTAADGVDPVTGVASGQTFLTWEDGRLRLYLNDGGAAVSKAELPSVEAILAILGIVSAAAFGAVGDGAADDTLALANFLTYVTANGARGWVPSGYYRITSPLAIAQSGEDRWVVEGAGSANTTIAYQGANTTNDIFVVGNGTDEVGRIRIAGITLQSDTVMTGGIGAHFKKLVRSSLYDFVIDGQDGTGNFWHGIRFNGLDSIYWDRFEARAQKDAVQVNGTVGPGPKADLHISNYKIKGDVGIRFGGAFGGFYPGPGSLAECGDSVVIDNTLAAEANREIFFSDLIVLDYPTRCNVVIDQSLEATMRVNFPSGMWVASSQSHGVWIKNANGAVISINAYIYNITTAGADGVRVDDVNAFVFYDHPLFQTITGAGSFAINHTVATSNFKISAPRFNNVTAPFNYSISSRPVSDMPFPVSVQGMRATYWKTFSSTTDESGNLTIEHGGGGNFYKNVLAVFGVVKSTGGANHSMTYSYTDATGIVLTSSAPFGSRPAEVSILVADNANTGW